MLKKKHRDFQMATLSRLILFMLLVVFITLFVLPLIPHVKNYYVLDILTNFQVQYLTIAASVAIVSVFISVRIFLGYCVTLICAFLTNFLFVFNSNISATHDLKNEIRIAQVNMHYFNDELTQAYRELTNKKADVYILFELNDGKKAQFMQFKQHLHSYGDEERQGFPAGIGVVTKYPIISSKLHRFENIKSNILELRLSVDGQPIDFIIAHPPSPRNELNWQKRNAVIGYLAEILSRTPKYSIIAADMNVTPWSRYFQSFEGYKACYRITGFYVSWTKLRLPLFLSDLFGIPIDHCFLSEPLSLTKFEVLEVPGSDHRALFYSIAWP